MSDQGVLYSRDLLYPTDVLYDPGSVHVEIFGPNKNGKIPVTIEGKTRHSPVKHIDSITRIMQSDIFDRIFVDIKNNVILYIVTDEELRKEYGQFKYIRVVFSGNGILYNGVDEIDEE